MGSTRFARRASGLLVPRPQFFQGNCPCCGGSGCTSFSDTFTRSDDTNIGSDWTETSGSWSIASNALTTTSGSGTATYNTAATATRGIVVVDFKVSASNTTAIVFLGTVTLELTLVSGSNSTMRIKNSGTLVMSKSYGGLSLNTYYTLTLCVDDDTDRVCGTISSPIDGSTWGYPAQSAVSGTDFGLSISGNTGTVTFDNFSASVGTGCPACSDCKFPCGICTTRTAPDQFQVDISGLADDGCTGASGLNGTFILTFDSALAAATAGNCYYRVLGLTGISCTNAGRTQSMFTELQLHTRVSFFENILLEYRNLDNGTFDQKIIWSKSGLSSSIDCSTLSGYSLPDVTLSHGDWSPFRAIDQSGSTVTITAL